MIAARRDPRKTISGILSVVAPFRLASGTVPLQAGTEGGDRETARRLQRGASQFLFGIDDVRGIRAAIGNYSKQGPSSQVSPGPPNVRRSGKGRLGRPFH